MNARDELMAVVMEADKTSNSPTVFTIWDHMTDAILAAGYSKPRTITTAEEIRELPALSIVVYDDMANGGPLQTYVVPDDGTVMFKDCEEFHLMTFGGDYIDAKDMPLPLTAVYEVAA